MDGGAWWAAVHGVAKTSLSLFTFMHGRRRWQEHSSVLAWRIPGTADPGGLPSMGSHRVRHDWSDLAAAAALTWDQKILDQNYLTIIVNKSTNPTLMFPWMVMRVIIGVAGRVIASIKCSSCARQCAKHVLPILPPFIQQACELGVRGCILPLLWMRRLINGSQSNLLTYRVVEWVMSYIQAVWLPLLPPGNTTTGQ